MMFKPCVNPTKLLYKCGYQKRYNDFFRYVDDIGNRFHANILEDNKIDIHLDKIRIVDGKKYHLSEKYGSWEMVKKEIKRIKQIK